MKRYQTERLLWHKGVVPEVRHIGCDVVLPSVATRLVFSVVVLAEASVEL